MMTDNEIIKAKLHFEHGIKFDIFSEPVLSYAKTVLEAFDEITRQKAEIERLEKELENERGLTLGRQTRILALKAEIERLQETICMLTKTGRFYGTVRAEAIKECIKTIKEKLRDLAKIDFQGQYCYLIAEAFFDNIFEEMVGDV